MKKLMRPKDKVLMLLANVGDVLMFLHEEVGIGKMSLRSLYGWMPSGYKRGNFNQVIKRMLKTGHIEKVVKKGEPYLRLTSRGRELIKRDFSLTILQKKKWDRKWRLVVFDIEEGQKKKRDYLQRKLKELGLGMMQKSVYLTPFDIAIDLYELVETIGLELGVYVMEVSNILTGEMRKLAAKIWPLEELNKKYKEILRALEKIRVLKGRYQKKKLEALKEKYVEILREDPYLPRELLPADWTGEKLRKILWE